MKKIIFTKYSSERDNRFKIKTSIIKDENNLLLVEKSPLSVESKLHINNMYKAYRLLNDNYYKEMIAINKCELKGESAQFEYLEGETLEKKLDDLLDARDYKGLFNQIIQYNKVINSVQNLILFEVTEDFTKIFGNVNLPYGLMAGSISNIDIIFSNIIINSKWNLIDYEWTFYFPVPINYTLYRAISYYINSSSKRKELVNMDLLKLLGVTEGEIEQYEIMERNFLSYTTGNSLTIGDIYNKIHGKCINVKSLAEIASKQLENGIQVFYDYGNGFNEKNSTKLFIEPDNFGKFIFKIDINNNIKRLRIDPSNDYCIISIEKLSGYKKGYYDIEYMTNGSNFDNKTIIFNTNDPQICVNRIDKDTSFVEAEIIIKEVPSLLGLYLNDAIHNSKQAIEKKYLIKINNLEEQIEKLSMQIEANEKNLAQICELESMISLYKKDALNCNAEVGRLNNLIKEYNEHTFNLENIIKEHENNLIKKDNIINELSESFCWKLTKPIRIVGNVSRKLFDRTYWLEIMKRIYRYIPFNNKIKNGFFVILSPSFKNADINNNTINNEKLILTDNNLNQDGKFYDICVSIVIPTYNGEIYLEQLLKTIKMQKGIKNIEIVIVDSDSKDNTVKICEENNVNLIKISQSEFSHSYSRNLGASKAHGDYLLFMTQDAVPSNEYWIYNMLTPIIKHDIVAVSCVEMPRVNCELAYLVESENFAKYLGVYNTDKIGSLPKIQNYETLRKNGQLSDVSCAISKSVFEKFKYYGDYAEDLDLGVKLIKAGYKIALLSSEKVIHSHNRPCGYYLKRAAVDGKNLKRIFPDFPINNQMSDNIISAIIFAYYKVICLLDYLQDNVDKPQTIEEFFKLINSYFESISSISSVSIKILQYGKIYSDETVDKFLNQIIKIYNKEHAQETYIINHIIHYINYTIMPFVKNHYDIVDKYLKNQIIDIIFKRFAIVSGNELSLHMISNQENIELKVLVDGLQKGV